MVRASASGTGPARNPIGQRRTLDQLHDERRGVPAVLEPVDVRDVRVIQRGEHLRLSPEPRQPVGSPAIASGSTFSATSRFELRVARAVDLAHPAGADGRGRLRKDRFVSPLLAAWARKCTSNAHGAPPPCAASPRLGEPQALRKPGVYFRLPLTTPAIAMGERPLKTA